jgi:hypothetical protein
LEKLHSKQECTSIIHALFGKIVNFLINQLQLLDEWKTRKLGNFNFSRRIFPNLNECLRGLLWILEKSGSLF